MLSASLNYLWEMINAQQIVILLPLFQIEIPDNVGILFSALMKIASFEAIPTDYIYYTLFFKGEGNPINQKFSELGF